MLKIPLIPYPFAGEARPCPLCGADEAISLSRWDRRLKPLPQVKCARCSLIRHAAMPTEAELTEYYRASYRSDYQNMRDGPSARHIAKRRIEAARRLEALARHLPSHASMIDFGCGSGEFVEAAMSQGFSAAGFEPGADYATYASQTRGLPVENCGWQDYAPPPNRADAVTSFHVFEHLTDPVSAMRRIGSWLKPDGLAYIEVPNMAKALYKGFGCLHMAHTIGFGRYSLELLGAMADMAVVEVIDGFDIGIIFKPGTPRDIDEIMADARQELEEWTQPKVHRQYFTYTLGKLTGHRPAALNK
ncbi:class I SAM-dependent methyltransferase [Roseicyclus sp.]|uniref:class I SAM-dependent methyltransferase n=1 Tax=Roseicyclus sp. TaxID=1914329 RepID=UPI003F6B642A